MATWTLAGSVLALTAAEENDICDDPSCVRAGRFKVSCYLCSRVYHSGCAGLPDGDFKFVRCCQTVLGPNGMVSIPNQNKVKCCECERHFFKMYARKLNSNRFTCVPCILNASGKSSSK